MELFESFDFDLSKFFLDLMNSKNVALVEESIIHCYVPNAPATLNITFLSDTKKEKYVLSIIEEDGNRILGKPKLNRCDFRSSHIQEEESLVCLES